MIASLREFAVVSTSAALLPDADGPVTPGQNTLMSLRLRQQFMKLLANRVDVLAFRTGERAHQKNDGDAVGVRARRQAAIHF